MNELLKIIKKAEKKKIAIGHFNIAELEMLKGISHAAEKLNLPVIIGTSEGEREYLGVHHSVDLIASYNKEHSKKDGFHFFLNADHTKSLEKVEEAARAGYDAVLFDGSHLPFEENIRQTKKAVEIVKKINPDILVEGEIGNIGSGSVIRKELPKGLALSSPKGAAIKPEDLTKPEEAARFVKETGVDLLAPAVGNIHGMLARRSLSEGGFAVGYDYPLDIERIRAIKKAAKVPLVLHGGSGNSDEDFLAAIDAGISIIHISTELRAAWRKAMDKSLKEKKNEIAPYKLMPEAIAEIEKIVYNRLKLFGKL